VVDLTDFGQAVEALEWNRRPARRGRRAGAPGRHPGPRPANQRGNVRQQHDRVYNAYSAAIRAGCERSSGRRARRARPALDEPPPTFPWTRITRRVRTARTHWSRRSKRNWPASSADGNPDLSMTRPPIQQRDVSEDYVHFPPTTARTAPMDLWSYIEPGGAQAVRRALEHDHRQVGCHRQSWRAISSSRRLDSEYVLFGRGG